jgi:hypothetical protein
MLLTGGSGKSSCSCSSCKTIVVVEALLADWRSHVGLTKVVGLVQSLTVWYFWLT